MGVVTIASILLLALSGEEPGASGWVVPDDGSTDFLSSSNATSTRTTPRGVIVDTNNIPRSQSHSSVNSAGNSARSPLNRGPGGNTGRSPVNMRNNNMRRSGGVDRVCCGRLRECLSNFCCCASGNGGSCSLFSCIKSLRRMIAKTYTAKGLSPNFKKLFVARAFLFIGQSASSLILFYVRDVVQINNTADQTLTEGPVN